MRFLELRVRSCLNEVRLIDQFPVQESEANKLDQTKQSDAKGLIIFGGGDVNLGRR